MKENLLTGRWEIVVIYGSGYGEFANKKLVCHAELLDISSKITGTIIDVSGVGMSPDLANIEGRYKNGLLKFIKRYVSLHTINHDYKIDVDKSIKGAKIYYEAMYNENLQEFRGKWSYGKKLFGFLKVGPRGCDIWTMKRLITSDTVK